MKVKKNYPLVLLCFIVAGCDLMSDKLEEVGRIPSLSKVNIYEEPFHPIDEQIQLNAQLKNLGYENGYQKDNLTHNNMRHNSGSANSIWKGGTSSFFKTYAVGDILSVIVQISDQAKLDNSTQKTRNSGTSIKAPSILGLESIVNKILPSTSPSENMINLKSNDASAGNGKVNRQETIQTVIAVTVIKLLPSGNLIVKGTQEVRVNFDVREIAIEGIIRPEDIANNNTVKLEQMAEARVSYGGRGQIFEYQQAPYGKQVLDIISPF